MLSLVGSTQVVGNEYKGTYCCIQTYYLSGAYKKKGVEQMQKIDGTTIKLNRGDILSLTLTLKVNEETDYTFQVGDTIVFSLYNKGKLSEDAILLKEITVEEATQSVNINLTSQETKIGDLIDKPIDYWYEIELNGQYTVIGYDDKGAKIFRLFPEGSKVV